MISKLINIIFNRYIIILDTYELIFNSNKNNYSYDILMKRKSLKNFIGEDTFKDIKKPEIKKYEKPRDIIKEKNELDQEENSRNTIKAENRNKEVNDFMDNLTNSDSNRSSQINKQNKDESLNNKSIFDKKKV